ncbi:MAG: ABC transporter permease [Hyphomicrobiales bacterium]|nr:ABC transporter permease [Hyphomicrobiales bacterium]MDE2115194.1 ABC transporter permease [Hyphomicrobiales bacterium]
MTSEFVQAVLLTILTSSIPLILAAIGELVAERAGVLNLGVEGMMICGAVSAFIGAYDTGSALIGAACGILAGALLAAVFGLLAIYLAVNQVAAGLALTIFGLGISGLIGKSYVGLKLTNASHLHLPWLSDIPYVGQILFGEDYFVYAAFALVLGVWLWLNKTHAGLQLRAVGDNHTSANTLGLDVQAIRLWAVLFGGGCAGLAGAYLTLAYTPFWSPGMTAGRGWIALALVVFASWQPWRLVLGALIFGGATILQLQAQALGVRIPSQLLSSVPYLATILALILLSVSKRGKANAPASLGQAFIADK